MRISFLNLSKEGDKRVRLDSLFTLFLWGTLTKSQMNQGDVNIE